MEKKDALFSQSLNEISNELSTCGFEQCSACKPRCMFTRKYAADSLDSRVCTEGGRMKKREEKKREKWIVLLTIYHTEKTHTPSDIVALVKTGGSCSESGSTGKVRFLL